MPVLSIEHLNTGCKLCSTVVLTADQLWLVMKTTAHIWTTIEMTSTMAIDTSTVNPTSFPTGRLSTSRGVGFVYPTA